MHMQPHVAVIENIETIGSPELPGIEDSQITIMAMDRNGFVPSHLR